MHTKAKGRTAYQCPSKRFFIPIPTKQKRVVEVNFISARQKGHIYYFDLLNIIKGVKLLILKRSHLITDIPLTKMPSSRPDQPAMM